MKKKDCSLKFWSMGKWELVDILEMTNGRAKRGEICDSRVLLEHVWVIFDLAVFNVIWGQFGALAIVQKYDFQTPLILHV